MTEEEIERAVEQFYKRREVRLRARLEKTTDLLEKYHLLKAIHHNRKKLIDKWLKTDTIKSKDIAKDGGPGSGNHGHKGVPGQIGGSAPTASSKGANSPCQGFEHKKTLTWKMRKHKAAYSGMSAEEYESHAIALLAKPCNEDIDGYLSADGSICRFNKKTGEFAKGYPGGYIKTCFNPGYNEKNGKFDLNRAIRYFQKHKAEEEIDDDDSE